MSGTSRRVTQQRGIITLVVLAALAVIVHGTVFSGASFNFLTSNPGNTVAAGTFWFTSDKDGAVIINAANLRPGQSRQGEMIVTGKGDLDADYTLVKLSVTDPAALSSALNLLVEDVTSGTTRYNGTIANLNTAGLGTILTGQPHTYRFTLTFLAAAALPGHQGATVTINLRTTGVAR